MTTAAISSLSGTLIYTTGRVAASAASPAMTLALSGLAATLPLTKDGEAWLVADLRAMPFAHNFELQISIVEDGSARDVAYKLLNISLTSNLTRARHIVPRPADVWQQPNQETVAE